MAFNVSFYQFNKKSSSTATPTGAGQTYACLANEPLDVLEPVIRLELAYTTQIPISVYNYARIPAFERWYWITGWTLVDGLWEARLRVDPLASWKSQIGSCRCYVYRAASSYDLDVIDHLYPTVDRQRKLQISVPKIWTVGGANAAGQAADTGVYILGIAGNNGTQFYAFEPAYFRTFLSYLFSNTFYEQVLGTFGAQEYPEAKVAVNPMQFITSAYYVPIGLIDSGYWGIRHDAAINHIPVGPVMVPPAAEFSNQRCYPLPDNATSFSIYDIDTTASDFLHPQSDDRGDWLNLSPYTSYRLFYPPFGLIELDPAEVHSHENLRIRVTLDARCCQVMLEVQVFDTAANIRTIYRCTGSFGVQIPVSNVIQPGTGTLQPLLTAGAGVVGGAMSMAAGNIGGGLLAMAQGIEGAVGQAVQGQIPHLSTMGGPGSTAGMDGIPKLYVTQWYMANDDLDGRGRPLLAVRLLSSLSGYIQADPDEIHVSCTATELAEIQSAVAAGFFYE